MQTLPFAQPFLSQQFQGTPKRVSSDLESLSAVEEKLLIALYRFHFLTIDQFVSYLGLSPNSAKWIQGKLRSLFARGFVDTQYLPRLTPSGRLPFIYMLGTKGITHFKELGFTVSYHSPKERVRSYLFLTHTLQLNHFLIAASNLSRVVSQVTLIDFKHERVLRHLPFRVDLPDGKKALVIPDGWLDFELHAPYGLAGENRFSCFVELDRDTEDITQVKSKIRAYLAFANGAYKAFGSDCFTVLFLIASGQDRRVQQLRKWTLEALTSQEAIEYSVFFKFALLPASPFNPAALFLSPQFSTLEDDRLVNLIEKIL